MKELDRRVARLEAGARSGDTSMYTISRLVDETDEEAIAAAGISPGPDDMVVMLTWFGDPFEDRFVSRVSLR